MNLISKPRSIGAILASTAVLSSVAYMVSRNEGVGDTTKIDGKVVAKAYKDPAHGWKVPTICYGHTSGVKKGQTATMDECKVYLREDIAKVSVPILNKYVKVPVTENQAVALADATFNLGSNLFIYKNKQNKWVNTQFYYALNNGQCQKAADLLLTFNKAGGKVLPGLTKRRKEESDLFRKDCHLWKDSK